MDKLRQALASFNSAVQSREEFRTENYDDEVGEPSCGYPHWDEYMADHAFNIAEAGEHLADVVKEFIGEA